MWTDRIRCALGRHDDVLKCDATGIYVQCTSCLRETPGWSGTPRQISQARRRKVLIVGASVMACWLWIKSRRRSAVVAGRSA